MTADPKKRPKPITISAADARNIERLGTMAAWAVQEKGTKAK